MDLKNIDEVLENLKRLKNEIDELNEKKDSISRPLRSICEHSKNLRINEEALKNLLKPYDNLIKDKEDKIKNLLKSLNLFKIEE